MNFFSSTDNAIFPFSNLWTTYFLATCSADKILDLCFSSRSPELLISVFCDILHLASCIFLDYNVSLVPRLCFAQCWPKASFKTKLRTKVLDEPFSTSPWLQEMKNLAPCDAVLVYFCTCFWSMYTCDIWVYICIFMFYFLLYSILSLLWSGKVHNKVFFLLFVSTEQVHWSFKEQAE